MGRPPPSRRRPRRVDVVSYRVRIDLTRTKPPVWRRLELASDLFLDDVHRVIQVAFGWWDYHLHRFGCGPERYGHDTEYYLCPFDVEEGETEGVPEEQVRLDEVLVDAGDKLFYDYDFGDGWELVLRLEAVMPRDDSAPRPVCLAGRRPAPHEDSGGTHHYKLLVAATDPTSPDHAEAVREYARYIGDEADPAEYRPTPFEAEEVNQDLAGFEFGAVEFPTDLPRPLSEVVDDIRDIPASKQLRQVIRQAELGEHAEVDRETAASMVRPYQWLLNHVGADGIKLTDAGYLPPVHVEATVAALGLDRAWIGKGNRESQTMPVLHLRRSAQAVGLLRRYRGSLVLTPVGRSLRARADPVLLWWHLADNLPVKSRHRHEVQAGLLLLLAVAAGLSNTDAFVAETLHAIGWRDGDGSPITSGMAGGAAWDTRMVLHRLDGLGDQLERPTPAGVVFARAALRTWPDGGLREGA
ncbi:MAG: plasmid pRiA4b ORF-3 family protein [Micromonosporaceae bacterium]|nr:plasmid pRiA4b ORF-3 family protein [Micromonosporaceae bacterium]